MDSFGEFPKYSCSVIQCIIPHYVMFLCPVDVPIQCAASIPTVSAPLGQDRALKFSTCCVTDWTIL